jgi:hypothetical protein
MVNNLIGHVPDANSIWRCPCGYTSEYKFLIGHRKGWKKRPQCYGKIAPAPEGAAIFKPSRGIIGPMPTWEDKEREAAIALAIKNQEEAQAAAKLAAKAREAELQAVRDHQTFVEQIDEDQIEDIAAEIDPEEIARRLNIEKGNYPHTPVPDHNATPPADGLDVLTPDGTWRIHETVPPQDQSNLREQVSLPVIARVYYDWAVQEGWDRGDRSFTAFIVDCLLDHFTKCWGKKILVADVNELGLASNFVVLASAEPVDVA